VRAYDDRLSASCRFALYRVSRHLEAAPNRIDRIADACK
jgi:hypothetical protein